jgi:hypothetical protein
MQQTINLIKTCQPIKVDKLIKVDKMVAALLIIHTLIHLPENAGACMCTTILAITQQNVALKRRSLAQKDAAAW